MMTHHAVHESFKNNISNNTHNIAQGGYPVFRGQMPPLAPLNATLAKVLAIENWQFMNTTHPSSICQLFSSS